MKRLFSTIALISFATQVFADEVVLRVAGWNMESGDSDAVFLKDQVGDKEDIDLWGFSEVRNNAAAAEFEEGAEIGENADFKTILGTTGGGDRLAITYNTERLNLVDHTELDDPLFSRHRAPLVATFKGEETGIEFMFMVNHLARGDANARLEQAEFLNDWVEDQTLPVIAVGDYNFDYHITFGDSGRRDDAFDAMIEDDHWIWLRPDTLLKTQASDRFKTVLDFVFVANPPMGWDASSMILAREGDAEAPSGDFDDTNTETDHRPVDAKFVSNAGPPRATDAMEDELIALQNSDAALLSRIEALEAEVADLKSQLSQ